MAIRAASGTMTTPAKVMPARPVRAVNSDHQRTMRMRVRRGPKTSPSQPVGTSKTA